MQDVTEKYSPTARWYLILGFNSLKFQDSFWFQQLAELEDNSFETVER